MKNLKRALSLVLSTAMLVGMMAVGTGAAHADVTAEHNVEAIEVVSAAGIMGANEEFNPDAKITRNEMAVVMVNMLGLDTDDFVGASTFTDVPEWAADYVDACYANGIVSGVSATEYNGGANVTTAEAALMMMKALGYFKFTVDFENDWMLATVKQASKINLLDDINAKATAAMTRNEVAQLALNALESNVVTGTNSSANTNISLGDAVISITGASTYTVDYAITVDSAVVDYNSSADGKLQLIEKLYEHDFTKDALTDEFGRDASIWVDMVEGDVISVAAKAPKFVMVADEAGTTLKDLVEDNKLEKLVDLTAAQEALTYAAGDVVELFMDKKTVTNIVTYYYAAAKIDEVEKCDEDIHEDAIEAGAEYVITIDGTDYFDIQFANFDAKTFVEDAVIVYPTQDGTMKVAIKDVVGNIDGVTGSEPYFLGTEIVDATEIKVDTKKAAEFVTAGSDKYVLSANVADLGADAIAVGAEFALYVDANGYVVAYEKIADADAVIEDVYYVDFVKTKSSTEYVGDSANLTYFAQLVAMDGTISTIELEKADKNVNDGVTAYTSAFNGRLVTISDKKWTVGATTFKADDNKFDLKLWTSADWDGEEGAPFSFNGIVFDEDSTRAGAYRITADTKFVVISETGSDLAAEVVTGGIDLTCNANMNGYVLTAPNKTVAKYVIIADRTAEIDEDTVYNSDIIYIKSAGTELGDGFVMQTVYFADGSKKTVKVDDAEYAAGALVDGAGFLKYDINKDGYYVLENCTDVLTVASPYVWDDEEGILENVEAVSLYEGLLTVDAPIYDIDVTNAKFVDAHSTTDAGQYTKTISSLEKLIDLMDDGVLSANTIQLNVAKDGAVVIILTSAAL